MVRKHYIDDVPRYLEYTFSIACSKHAYVGSHSTLVDIGKVARDVFRPKRGSVVGCWVLGVGKWGSREVEARPKPATAELKNFFWRFQTGVRLFLWRRARIPARDHPTQQRTHACNTGSHVCGTYVVVFLWWYPAYAAVFGAGLRSNVEAGGQGRVPRNAARLPVCKNTRAEKGGGHRYADTLLGQTTAAGLQPPGFPFG